MATNGPSARFERSWRARATRSLPVPLSPSIRMVASVIATVEMRWKTSRMAGDAPTISPIRSAVRPRSSSRRRAFSASSARSRPSRSTSRDHCLVAERLLDVVRRADPHGLDRLLDRPVPGHEDDGAPLVELDRSPQDLHPALAPGMRMSVSTTSGFSLLEQARALRSVSAAWWTSCPDSSSASRRVTAMVSSSSAKSTRIARRLSARRAGIPVHEAVSRHPRARPSSASLGGLDEAVEEHRVLVLVVRHADGQRDLDARALGLERASS